MKLRRSCSHLSSLSSAPNHQVHTLPPPRRSSCATTAIVLRDTGAHTYTRDDRPIRSRSAEMQTWMKYGALALNLPLRPHGERVCVDYGSITQTSKDHHDMKVEMWKSVMDVLSFDCWLTQLLVPFCSLWSFPGRAQQGRNQDPSALDGAALLELRTYRRCKRRGKSSCVFKKSRTYKMFDLKRIWAT